jgi:hypothetical protein
MSLWTPPKVDRDLREQTQAHASEVTGMVERFRGILKHYTRELKAIDPYLELIFAPPNAEAPGLVPGRYHVMRHNPGAPPSLIPIQGPNGEFSEPTSQVFEQLKSTDLWNTAVGHERRRREEAAERASVRAKEREQAERAEEVKDRWNAATRTFVSMDRSKPWSQNAAGRRGAGGGRRG